MKAHSALRNILFLFSLLFFTGSAYSQNVANDSIARDSLNKEFNKQVKDNAASQGIDTSHFNAAPPDTSGLGGIAPDTVRRDSAYLAKKAARHSAKKAALLSLAFPGLGQAYNKKYWKMPIIYAGFGGLGYAIYYTASNFYGYRKAYRAHVATVPDPTAQFNGVSDQATLKSARDYFKTNYDISVIITVVWYVINIIDATVDGHLFDWNMKDDISVSWRPALLTPSPVNSAMAPGLNFCLRF